MKYLFPDLFPQLDHQKRVIAKSMKKQRKKGKNSAGNRNRKSRSVSPAKSSQGRQSRSRSKSSGAEEKTPYKKHKQTITDSDTSLTDDKDDRNI